MDEFFRVLFRFIDCSTQVYLSGISECLLGVSKYTGRSESIQAEPFSSAGGLNMHDL